MELQSQWRTLEISNRHGHLEEECEESLDIFFNVSDINPSWTYVFPNYQFVIKTFAFA